MLLQISGDKKLYKVNCKFALLKQCSTVKCIKVVLVEIMRGNKIENPRNKFNEIGSFRTDFKYKSNIRITVKSHIALLFSYVTKNEF